MMSWKYLRKIRRNKISENGDRDKDMMVAEVMEKWHVHGGSAGTTMVEEE